MQMSHRMVIMGVESTGEKPKMKQNLDPVTAYLTADRNLFTEEELEVLKKAAERHQENMERKATELFR